MIRFQKDTDHIALLTLDMEGRAHNVINHEILEAFVPVIEHLKEEKAKGQLKGVILTSAKKSFLAGGDFDYLYQANDPEEIFNISQKLKTFFRDLERPGVPVVAAINGNALGTGFELALACHHRIVVNDNAMRLGLPEVSMGLIPGGGGIVRLMWLLGIEKAFPILTKGRRYSPEEALRVGIIDELAQDRKDMIARAKQRLLSSSESHRPWDTEGGAIPGGTAREPRLAHRLRLLAAELSEHTYNNYPAPQAVLNVLAEGSKVDFDTACRIESRYYTQLLRSRQCKNMIKAFWFDTNFIHEGKYRPKGFGKFRPKKVGVIGAGQMGSGIALACLMSGLEVVIKDVSRLIAQRGRAFVERRLDELRGQVNLSDAQRSSMLSRLSTADHSGVFADCDLVIEAVFENPNVKQKVTKEAEAYMDEYSLFGTNTLSIPISTLAKASTRPENYVGLHFFAPAEMVPLVEIVRGERTSEESIARAFDFVRAIHKTPIVVKDDWGFFVARVQNTYLLEGVTMLQEGIPASLIENLGRQAGMPRGPLALADELSLEIALRYENQAADHYGSKYIQHPAVHVLQRMLDPLQRPGRHKRAGFYQYSDENERALWEGLTEEFPEQANGFEPREIMERLLFAQVIEAAWCLQEKVIESTAAANLGSILGWGFPSFTGGVLEYVQDYGYAEFAARCDYFREKHGQRFRLPRILKQSPEELPA